MTVTQGIETHYNEYIFHSLVNLHFKRTFPWYLVYRHFHVKMTTFDNSKFHLWNVYYILRYFQYTAQNNDPTVLISFCFIARIYSYSICISLTTFSLMMLFSWFTAEGKVLSEDFVRISYVLKRCVSLFTDTSAILLHVTQPIVILLTYFLFVVYLLI